MPFGKRSDRVAGRTDEPGVDDDTWITMLKVCSDFLLSCLTRKTGPSENISLNSGSENVYDGLSNPIAISVKDERKLASHVVS